VLHDALAYLEGQVQTIEAWISSFQVIDNPESVAIVLKRASEPPHLAV
jgi:hypothetical protein